MTIFPLKFYFCVCSKGYRWNDNNPWNNDICKKRVSDKTLYSTLVSEAKQDFINGEQY